MQSASSSTKPQFPLLENEGSGSERAGQQQGFSNLADYKNKPLSEEEGEKKRPCYMMTNVYYVMISKAKRKV